MLGANVFITHSMYTIDAQLKPAIIKRFEIWSKDIKNSIITLFTLIVKLSKGFEN
jgi:hypothetical protein